MNTWRIFKKVMAALRSPGPDRPKDDNDERNIVVPKSFVEKWEQTMKSAFQTMQDLRKVS